MNTYKPDFIQQFIALFIEPESKNRCYNGPYIPKETLFPERKKEEPKKEKMTIRETRYYAKQKERSKQKPIDTLIAGPIALIAIYFAINYF